MIIYLSTNPFFGSDYFAFFNILIFGITNGYATTAHMALAPEQVENDEKELSGFLMSFPLFFGILSGSMIALAFSNLK